MYAVGLIVVMALSVAGNVLLGASLASATKKNQQLRSLEHLNDSVLNFANLFISKVLRAEGEVSFEDRLQLENAVRDTKDKDIYDTWQRFVGAQTEEQGREEIKNLLQVIVNKLAS